MRTRYRWDKDMQCLVEIRDGMNMDYDPRLKYPVGVVRDTADYLAVGIQDPNKPKGHGLWINGGRRQHRDELRARNLTEVGNETKGWDTPAPMPSAAPAVREALARTGYFDGARTLRDLRRRQFR